MITMLLLLAVEEVHCAEVQCTTGSRLTCRELVVRNRLDPGVGYKFSDQLGSIDVCGASPSHAITKCYKAPLAEAAGICGQLGARLCSLSELLNNEAVS